MDGANKPHKASRKDGKADSQQNETEMDEEHEAEGNMRACGCHAGRPCECGMGEDPRPWLAPGAVRFECGACANCRLNARQGPARRAKDRRRCLQYDAYVAGLEFDVIVLRGGCVFRMRKPSWR
jgi:hypothetical protein